MSDMAILGIVIVIALLMAGVLWYGTQFINQQRRTSRSQLIGGGVGDIVTGALGFTDMIDTGSTQQAAA
jgi:hypothetical protein